jgi:membrane-bound inhibitor of C-type lysozyme
MSRATALFRVIAAAVSSAGLVAGCAEFDQSAVVGDTATLICDGGKTFTVTYQDGYETALIESEGRRAELTKVRTTIGDNPTPPLPSSLNTGDTAFQSRTVQVAPATGTTGVRYSDGDNLLLSRGRQATLEFDGETYSNCETPK